MPLPIVFNNTPFSAGSVALDLDGVDYVPDGNGGQFAIVSADSVSTETLILDGVINAPGDAVQLAVPSTGDTFTLFATSIDDANNLILQFDNPDGQDFPYIFSNQPLTTGQTLTFREFDLGDYVVCYCAGTRILTASGETPVEALAIGDLVVTASGALRPVKWIGTRAYAGRFANANPGVRPIRFKAGSLADGVPARDLRVSPKHAMLLDGVLIPAERLVNGATIVKEARVDEVVYFHVELDGHDVLIAEGAASESFVDDEGRGIFHNSRSFAELYPDETRTDAVYCAPRVEHGYAFEAVRRRLDQRAGLAVPAARRFGVLRGTIEGFDGAEVRGWASDALYPDAPVCLDVLADGAVVGLAYADRPTATRGAHGFAFTLPPEAQGARSVTLRRSGDGAPLESLAQGEARAAA